MKLDCFVDGVVVQHHLATRNSKHGIKAPCLILLLVSIDFPFLLALRKSPENDVFVTVTTTWTFAEEAEDIKLRHHAGLLAAIKAVVEGLGQNRWVSVSVGVVVSIFHGGHLFWTGQNIVRVYFMELLDCQRVPSRSIVT